MRRGWWMLLGLAMWQAADAKLHSGTLEFKVPSQKEFDNLFDFSVGGDCGYQGAPSCVIQTADVSLDSAGLLAPRGVSDWGVLDTEAIFNVYFGPDSAKWGGLQGRIDTLLKAKSMVVDSQDMDTQLPLDRITQGMMFVIRTSEGKYALLIPIGRDSRGDFTHYAFYWAYQDDGSANLFDGAPSGAITRHPQRRARRASLPSQPGALTVDALGRILFARPQTALGGGRGKPGFVRAFSLP